MSPVERNIIIQNQQDLKQDLREIRASVTNFSSDMTARLDAITLLLNVHDERMDKFELKQVQDKNTINGWIESKKAEVNTCKIIAGLKERRRAWLYPLIAFILAAIITMILTLR
jgi:hypothetical protein